MSSTPFLLKVHELIEVCTCPSEIADWDESGTSFYIKDAAKFVKYLPSFFRHSNLKSFVRQLNLYGFNKLRNTGSLQPTSSQTEGWQQFRHDRFIRGNIQLIKSIQRKQTHVGSRGGKAHAGDAGAGTAAAAGTAGAAGVASTTGATSAAAAADAPDAEKYEALQSRVASLAKQLEVTKQGMAEFQKLLQVVQDAVKRLPPAPAPLPPPPVAAPAATPPAAVATPTNPTADRLIVIGTGRGEWSDCK
eukprot:g5680.t1